MEGSQKQTSRASIRVEGERPVIIMQEKKPTEIITRPEINRENGKDRVEDIIEGQYQNGKIIQINSE
jgi:hypothetical protein